MGCGLYSNRTKAVGSNFIKANKSVVVYNTVFDFFFLQKGREHWKTTRAHIKIAKKYSSREAIFLNLLDSSEFSSTAQSNGVPLVGLGIRLIYPIIEKKI
jgi:hypothetical protein